jgi:hypothetical protein
MKRLIYILLWLIPQIGCGQTYLHTTVREEALSNASFFSTLWVAEKGVYKITLMIPEHEQVVEDTIKNEVLYPDIDTFQREVFRDPMMPIMPEPQPYIESEPVPTGRDLSPVDPSPTTTTDIGATETPIKIKPKPLPVVMVEDVMVMQLKVGTYNTLQLKDTTYWIVVDGSKKLSEPLKPTVRKEWECCYLIYEWIIELYPDQNFQIWHNDQIKDYEQGDYTEARDQYFSEVVPGEKIPDYYRGLILKVEAFEK